jgi:hypothetical protein
MMRERKWFLAEALSFVKEKRRIVKPNTGFIAQLREWEVILQTQNFVADSAFTRKSVSILREHHETKSTGSHSSNDFQNQKLKTSKIDINQIQGLAMTDINGAVADEEANGVVLDDLTTSTMTASIVVIATKKYSVFTLVPA